MRYRSRSKEYDILEKKIHFLEQRKLDEILNLRDLSRLNFSIRFYLHSCFRYINVSIKCKYWSLPMMAKCLIEALFKDTVFRYLIVVLIINISRVICIINNVSLSTRSVKRFCIIIF